MSIWPVFCPVCTGMQSLAHLRHHKRLAAGLAQRWPALCRGYAEHSGSETITVEPSPFRGHRVRACLGLSAVPDAESSEMRLQTYCVVLSPRCLHVAD